MNLRTTTYKSSMRAECIELMRDTWNFESQLPDIPNKNLINALFFDSAVIGMSYQEVIVDDRGTVKGYLFGHIVDEHPVSWRNTLDLGLFYVKVLWCFFKGEIGNARELFRVFSDLEAVENQLQSARKPEDAYVGLFFISSKLRGLGWGKRLMENFEAFGQLRGAHRLYLWTDKSCNFGFYDHTGFKRMVEITSPLLAEFSDEPNGFAYARAIKPAIASMQS